MMGFFFLFLACTDDDLNRHCVDFDLNALFISMDFAFVVKKV